MDFSRSAQPLTFEASSGIFVGNAGGTGLPGFVVSLRGFPGLGGLDILVFVNRRRVTEVEQTTLRFQQTKEPY